MFLELLGWLSLFSGVILNNNESKRTRRLLKTSTFLIAALKDGNLFWDKD